jgi:myo-inositol-1(or 4)-monophosphatase
MTDLEFALAIAARASEILKEGAFRSHAAAHKQAATDLVTEFDQRSEQLIVGAITQQFPGDSILAEEGGAQDRGERRWLIDPLDGTTNFAHGLPFFCVSIGLEIAGRPDVGVVAVPALDWIFAAARGQGATLNGRPIRVSATSRLSEALLATGFPYDNATSPENNFDRFVHLYKCTQGVRRVGAAALDLCMVAAGWMDGYWERKLKPWDMCAGAVIVEEAGGRVTDYKGAAFSPHRPEIVASNGHIHAELVAEL